MKDAVDTIQPSEEISQLPFNAIDYLAGIKGREVSKARRIEITASCKDCNYIPKVSAAGKVLKNKVGQTYQIMHNGIKVVVDGYYGPWVTELIKKLQGHHEPQEEKVFYELAKLFQPNTTMIELGSYWAYYSLWFHKAVKGGFNICCEPDPRNTEIGQINFALNGYNEGVKFINAAAGQDDGKVISFDAEHVADKVRVPIRSVDSLVKEYKIERLEVLHMDVQGAEYDALLGAAETIKSGRLRFVFVSTHHYLISRNPDIHNKCIEYIESLGGHIICEHGIHESFSGDGLIVASFDAADKDKKIDVSLNRMSNNQFREYTRDLELTFGAYDVQLKRVVQRKHETQSYKINVDRLMKEQEQLNVRIAKMGADINFLNNLSVKASFKGLLKSIYRSLKYRIIKLIWGAYGYKNTVELTNLASQKINSLDQAKTAVEVLNHADKKNATLLLRNAKTRRFIFEFVRKCMLITRKIIGPRNRGEK